MSDSPATVYLLHFTQPYRHARHYVGYTSLPIEDRMARHRDGSGSNLIRRLRAEGGDFVVAKTWEYPTRGEAMRAERAKKRGGHAQRCPVCKGAKS